MSEQERFREKTKFTSLRGKNENVCEMSKNEKCTCKTCESIVFFFLSNMQICDFLFVLTIAFHVDDLLSTVTFVQWRRKFYMSVRRILEGKGVCKRVRSPSPIIYTKTQWHCAMFRSNRVVSSRFATSFNTATPSKNCGCWIRFLRPSLALFQQQATKSGYLQF